MIITKRPFKLKQVLMNLEPGQISVDANNRDSLIKMGREAGVGGGEGGGSGAGKHQVEEFRHLLFHTLAIDLHERRFVMNLEHLDTGLVVLPFIRRCVNWK